MPKLSVSVPDDLWKAALRRAGAGAKPSQVVQTALRAFTQPTRPPKVFKPGERPVPDTEFGKAAESMLAEARDIVQDGYRAGLSVAEKKRGLGIYVLSRLIATRDPDELLRVKDDNPLADPTYWSIVHRQLKAQGPFGELWRTGWWSALDDLWEEVSKVTGESHEDHSVEGVDQ